MFVVLAITPHFTIVGPSGRFQFQHSRPVLPVDYWPKATLFAVKCNLASEVKFKLK